jgi:hypothetical protein
MNKIPYTTLITLVLMVGMTMGHGTAQGGTPPSMNVSVAVLDQYGNLTDTYQVGEDVRVVVAVQNVGLQRINAYEVFGQKNFHLNLRFTYVDPDGKKRLITATHPGGLLTPPPPRVKRIGNQLVQVDLVSIWQPGSSWTTVPFVAQDFYDLSQIGAAKCSVQAVIPLTTYPTSAVQMIDGLQYAPIASADWYDAIKSIPVGFTILADNDGDGYPFPEPPGSPPEDADCNDYDADVNPGMTEIPNNGIDDDCDPATPDAQVPPGSVSIDIQPDTLNLKAQGNRITCYIELLEGYNVADIDVNTVKITSLAINGGEPVQVSIPAELQPTEVGDYDADGTPDLKVKFSRWDLQEAIGGPGEVAVTVEVWGSKPLFR